LFDSRVKKDKLRSKNTKKAKAKTTPKKAEARLDVRTDDENSEEEEEEEESEEDEGEEEGGECKDISMAPKRGEFGSYMTRRENSTEYIFTLDLDLPMAENQLMIKVGWYMKEDPLTDPQSLMITEICSGFRRDVTLQLDFRATHKVSIDGEDLKIRFQGR
jgi:hypothetical protein